MPSSVPFTFHYVPSVFAVYRDESIPTIWLYFFWWLKCLIDIEIWCRLCTRIRHISIWMSVEAKLQDFGHEIVTRQSHISYSVFAAYLDYNFQFIFRLMIITFYYNLYVKSAGGNQMKTYLKFAVVFFHRFLYRRCCCCCSCYDDSISFFTFFVALSFHFLNIRCSFQKHHVYVSI